MDLEIKTTWLNFIPSVSFYKADIQFLLLAGPQDIICSNVENIIQEVIDHGWYYDLLSFNPGEVFSSNSEVQVHCQAILFCT